MNYIKKLAIFLKGIGGLSLIGMMLLTCADVAGSVFGHPILGAEEIVALWASILLAFSLPAAHLDGANVGVDLLYLKLPDWYKRINDAIITLIAFVLFLLMTWQCYLYAKALQDSGEVSMTLQLPAFYLVYAVSFALLVLSIAMLVEFITYISGGSKTCQNQ